MDKRGKFDCAIEGYGYDGEGVGRLDGKVVFVPYALRGERVEIEFVDEHSSFYRGKLKKVLKASDKREVAPCRYFGRCGGCSYQHTSYQNELDIKKELLANQLKKVGYDGEIAIEPSDERYGYRNKIRLIVGRNGLALRERCSHEAIGIEKCLLVSEEMNAAIETLNRFISAQKLFNFYSEVVLRQEGESLGIIFYCKKEQGKTNYQGVFLMLGAKCVIYESFKGKLFYCMGQEYLESEEHGLKCKFLPNSFHQVNKFVGGKLYQFVAKKLQGKVVLNCYSGAGVLSGFLSNLGYRVIGIELGESEHKDAERLKEENSLFFLTNMQGDCSEVLPRVEGDAIIVDPPRAGLDAKVCQALNYKNCNQLIYISCNSATLVRDLGRLVEYKIKEIVLFDMFACTGEYETVVILERK